MTDFTWIGTVVVLVPSTVALFRYEHFDGPVLPRLAFLVWWNALVEVLVTAAYYSGYGNNMPLYHIYMAVEFALLSWVFWAMLPEVINRTRWLIGVGVFWAMILSKAFKPELFYEFPSLLRSFESLILIGLSIVYFWKVLQKAEEPFLLRSPGFWVGAAVLTYYGSTTLVYAYTDYIMEKSDELFTAVWSVLAILNVVFYSMLICAFLCQKLKAKS